jgi:hypothetical protein
MRSAGAALIGLGLDRAAAPQTEAPVTLQTSPPTAKAEVPAVLPPGAAQYEPAADGTRANGSSSPITTSRTSSLW